MKIRHILKKKEFAEILAEGKKARTTTITAYTSAASEAGSALGKEAIGLIIPKKMVDNAVTRNYLRRSIYAYFREFPGKKGKKKRRIIRIIKPVTKKTKKTITKTIKREIKKLLEKEC